MDTGNNTNPLSRFFSGLTEYTFEARLGVADPPLIDYLSSMLTRFVHFDSIYRMRDTWGRQVDELAAMVAEANDRIGDARREGHRHIGDFALFWTGVYPETLRSTSKASRFDRFVDFTEQGKRAYYIASTISASEDSVEGDVLARLSHEFELCAYGLNEVRKEWERRDDQPPSRPFVIN